MGGDILGFVVFRFCFVLFFVNGIRLKLWSFVIFCFSWRELLFRLGFFCFCLRQRFMFGFFFVSACPWLVKREKNCAINYTDMNLE